MNVGGKRIDGLWQETSDDREALEPVRPYKKIKVDEVIGSSVTLSGDVSGLSNATVVDTVGTKTAAEIAASVNDTQAATDALVNSTIVKRDAGGDATVDALTASTVSSTGLSLNVICPSGFLNLTGQNIVLNPTSGEVFSNASLVFKTTAGPLTLKSDASNVILESSNQITFKPGGLTAECYKMFSSGVSNFYRPTSTASQQIINFRSDVDVVDSIQSQILADGSFTGTADLKLNSADTATDYQATTLKFGDAYTLTDEGAGTITVTPNAKTVMPVGEFFWAETPVARSFVANTWTNLAALSPVLSGWTFGGHSDWFSLTSTLPNVPRLRWDGTDTEYMHTALSLSAASSSAGVTVEVGLTKNNAASPDLSTVAFWDFANNNAFASYAFHKVFSLAASDDLSIMIRTSSNVDLTFSNINFVIVAGCMRQSTDP